MSFFRRLSSIRVFFISAGQLVACLRRGKDVTVEARFNADEKGYAVFARYLAESPRLPVYLVADLIEEDFRNETVPHAAGSDHRALVERKFSQFFHNTPYRCARRQGRQRSGRRDDQILFSALTNNEYLSSWIEPVLAANLPLAGITSVAQLSEIFARRLLREDAPHLLLVSHQRHSGLRQTYILRGRLKFSRLTPFIPKPEAGQSDPLVDELIEECRRTRQYLERQRWIGNDAALDIHVYPEPEDLERFLQDLPASPLQRFHIHDLGTEALSHGIETTSRAPGAFTRFLLRAIRSLRLPNHYAPADTVRYQRIRQIRLGLIFANALFFLAAGTAAVPLFSAGFKDLAHQRHLHGEALVLREKYEVLRRYFPAVPVPTEIMQQTVETIDSLRRTPSPVDFAVQVSQALNNCPEIRLLRFSWQMQSAQPDPQTPGATNVRGRSPSGEDATPTEAMITALIEGKSRMTARLGGIIAPFTSQRAAHDSLGRFVAALQALPGIKARLLEMPLETSPDAQIKTRVGQGADDPAFLIEIEGGAS